jgi:hypothetical protein
MAIDGRLQTFDVIGARRAVDGYRRADVLDARANAVVDGKEAAQVEAAGELDRDAVERDSQRIGIEAVRDLLSRS